MKKNAPAKPVTPRTALRALKRRALYLLLPFLIILPGAAFYVKKAPKKFLSRALVGSEPLVPWASLDPPPDLSAATAQEQMRAIKETVLGRTMIEQVMREYNLYDVAEGVPSQTTLDAVKARVQIQIDGPEAFYLGFESPDPKQSMDVANRMAGLFVRRTSVLRDQQVDQQDNVLDQQVNTLRRQVAAQEAGLKQYEQEASQELPERLQTNLKQNEDLRDQIQAKTDQITEAEGRRAAIVAEMKALEGQGVLAAEPPEKTPAQTQIESLQRQLADLLAKYTPENPDVKRIQKQIADLKAAPQAPAPVTHHDPSPQRLRYIALQAELTAIDPKLKSYRQDRDVLTGELRDDEQKLDAAPEYASTISQRTRDVAATRNQYEALLAKQQDAQLHHREEKTDQGLAYKILEPATLPVTPESPRPDRILLVALAACFGLGLASVLLAERMDTSFESVEQLEEFSDFPVLSGVPVISARRRRRAGKNSKALKQYWRNRIVMVSDPQSIAAQQYGILALKLSHRMEETGGKVLVVTSSTGAEGKSVTSVNLSLALAGCMDGRVALVDGDLRLPQVAERLDLAPGKGLGDWLAASASDASEYVMQVGNLDVISGGSKPEDPLAALASPRMREIIEQLRSKYDFIVIDSPPVVPIADSHVLARLADGVLIVVRSGRTRPELLERAVESLGAARIVGVILNGLEYSASPYAYAYRYYQQRYLGRS